MKFFAHNPALGERLFMAIKYLTYGLLIYNGYLFFLDESAASSTTFSRGLSLSEIIEVYSATIDTTFWIMLVVLLELETYIIDDEVLKKTAVKWTMIGLRTTCYMMITYALYGYIVKTGFQSDMVPFMVASACDVVGQNFSILVGIEDYVALSAENCGALDGKDLYQLNGHNIIAPLAELVYARNVASIDIFNASAWLGVVLVLEVDVWYQLKGDYKGILLKVSYALKGILYSILFGALFAWAYTGDLLDITDSAVWLFAFFFIELNLIQWQQETTEGAEAEESATIA